jgi:hypothetical protein
MRISSSFDPNRSKLPFGRLVLFSQTVHRQVQKLTMHDRRRDDDQRDQTLLPRPFDLFAELFCQAKVEDVVFLDVALRLGKALCVFNDTFHKIRGNYAAVR